MEVEMYYNDDPASQEAMQTPNERFQLVLNTLDAIEQPFVQAHINNISFPRSIKELEVFVYEHRRYNIEDILEGDGKCRTVSRNCKVGDVVLWFHAKTAISRITALITQVRELPESTSHDTRKLLEWLGRARELYKKYGGKIFAIGRIVGAPERIDFPDANDFHFGGRIYADVGDITVLETPVDISAFNSFAPVGFVDNVFGLNEKYVLLEVKLNTALEKDLPGQLKRYMKAEYVYLDAKRTKWISDFERRYMYVIDTVALWRYELETDALREVIKLDDVHSAEDVRRLLDF